MRQCEVCGGEIVRLKNEGAARFEDRKFCGRVCWAKSRQGVARPGMRKRSTRPCAACGKDVEIGGRAGQREFCSTQCAAAARWRTGSRANQLTVRQAAYLAGLVDGEGSIILHRHHGAKANVALRLSIASTHRGVLEWCRDTCSVGNIIGKGEAPAHGRHKASYMWLVNSQAASSVLEQIADDLIIKKEQAQLAIEFQRKLKVPKEKADREWQNQWRDRLRAMNARGPVEA